MRKSTWVGLAILATVLIIGGVWLAKKNRREANQVRIGAILPLTGNLAILGEPGRNALTIGKEDLQAQGQNIDIKFYDSQADPTVGVTAFQRAADVDGLKFTLTTLTGVSSAIKPIANNRNIFQGMVAIAPNMVEGSNTAVRFCFNGADEAKAIINRIKSSDVKSVFILWSRDGATEPEVSQFLKPALSQSQIKFEEETFDVGQKDFKGQILKLKTSSIKDVILLGYGSDFPGILKEMSTQGLLDQVKVIGGIGYLELPAYLGYDLVKNAIFMSPAFLVQSEANDRSKDFMRRYKQRFSTEVTYDAAYTYDALMILADAFKNSGGTDPASVRSYILKKGTFQGVSGPLSFQANGEVLSPLTLARYNSSMSMEKVQ